MNIVILVAGLPPDRIGGAERQAAQLAAQLCPRHDVTILTRTERLPPELDGLAGCRVVRRSAIDWRGARFVADIVSTLWLLRRSRRTTDVVIAYQTVIDGLIGVLAKRLFGMPVLVWVRAEAEYRIDRDTQSWLLSPFVFRHADRIATQSPALRDGLLAQCERSPGRIDPEAIRHKLCVLPNGIPGVSGGPADGESIVFVGRLNPAKGVDVLIEAMRGCVDQSLVIVGDGPARPALERAAAGLANVRFEGGVPHAMVSRYLATAKALVLPSVRDEGQPNVIMEAMSQGVPVIATRTGGVTDLVRHGETGLLADPGDAAALARHIAAIGRDAALRHRLAANGLAEMRQYCWPRVLPLVERELEAVVRGAAAPATRLAST